MYCLAPPFAALQQVRAAGWMPTGHVRLCVGADGAAWIWQQGKARLPDAHSGLTNAHGAPEVSTSFFRFFRIRNIQAEPDIFETK